MKSKGERVQHVPLLFSVGGCNRHRSALRWPPAWSVCALDPGRKAFQRLARSLGEQFPVFLRRHGSRIDPDFFAHHGPHRVRVFHFLHRAVDRAGNQVRITEVELGVVDRVWRSRRCDPRQCGSAVAPGAGRVQSHGGLSHRPRS